MKASRLFSLLLPIILFLSFAVFSRAGESPEGASKSQSEVSPLHKANGDINSDLELKTPEAIASATPNFSFGVVDTIIYILREFFFPVVTHESRLIEPLFTNSYLSNLFCRLIAINAP